MSNAAAGEPLWLGRDMEVEAGVRTAGIRTGDARPCKVASTICRVSSRAPSSGPCIGWNYPFAMVLHTFLLWFPRYMSLANLIALFLISRPKPSDNFIAYRPLWFQGPPTVASHRTHGMLKSPWGEQASRTRPIQTVRSRPMFLKVSRFGSVKAVCLLIAFIRVRMLSRIMLI